MRLEMSCLVVVGGCPNSVLIKLSSPHIIFIYREEEEMMIDLIKERIGGYIYVWTYFFLPRGTSLKIYEMHFLLSLEISI